MSGVKRQALPKQEIEADNRPLYINILINLGLLFLSSIIFTLSFPNPLTEWGFAPLAFIALIPIFILIHRATWLGIFLYGFLYGFVNYALFNYWLINFHPLSIFIVPVIYAIYFLFFFPVLKAADVLFPRYGYLVQICIWMAYEYFRIQGFLGYAYGIIGYSQYTFIPFIQIAGITGVWAVSLLVVFPSALLGSALRHGFNRLVDFFKRHMPEVFVYGAVFIAVLIYGFFSQVDYSDSRRLRVATVQQNVDPKIGGLRAYRTSLNILLEQSREALKEEPEMIIWSETSFVPAIDYHTKYRGDPKVYALVKELIEFLEKQEIPFLFGNGDGQLIRNADGQLERVDYNSTILFDGGDLKATYRKVHLVPFTEHFPYKKQFPWFYNALVEANTSFWKRGEDFVVYEAAGVRFSTPICFEDTFGYISRRFVNEGAEMIINLTNDSWSESVPAAMQHMAMAVFRAVENKRTVVRSTNGGISCVIDPNGRILSIQEPFTEGYMISEAPVFTARDTFYSAHGEYLAVFFSFFSVVLVIFGLVRRILEKRKGPTSLD